MSFITQAFDMILDKQGY